jgi:site-specific DNA-cytosine methylase
LPGQRVYKIPDSVSDTQAYRQFGNAVVVPVVEAIARVMVPRILEPEVYPPALADQLELIPVR